MRWPFHFRKASAGETHAGPSPLRPPGAETGSPSRPSSALTRRSN